MAKYIIDIKDGETLYKAVIAPDGEPYITPVMGNVYKEPDLDAIRNEAYEKGVQDTKQHWVDAPRSCAYQLGYENGLNDAWKVADKIFDMPCLRREQIFSKCDSVGVWDILRKYSASEAIEKIRQYEQEQQFHVGDEIETQNGFKGFVISADDKYVYFVNENGEGCVETMMAAKTGRHFPELAEVLRKRGEE